MYISIFMKSERKSKLDDLQCPTCMSSMYKKRVKRVKIIYFDKKKHDIEETNTETFMCRSMSATNAYTEL